MRYTTISGREIDPNELIPEIARCQKVQQLYPKHLMFFRTKDCCEAYGADAIAMAEHLPSLTLDTKQVTNSDNHSDRIHLLRCSIGMRENNAEILLNLGHFVSICDIFDYDGTEECSVQSWIPMSEID